MPSPETLPFPSVTQPKRTFTTVRTPKDIASENSISRYVATLGPPLLWDIQGEASTRPLDTGSLDFWVGAGNRS